MSFPSYSGSWIYLFLSIPVVLIQALITFCGMWRTKTVSKSLRLFLNSLISFPHLSLLYTAKIIGFLKSCFVMTPLSKNSKTLCLPLFVPQWSFIAVPAIPHCSVALIVHSILALVCSLYHILVILLGHLARVLEWESGSVGPSSTSVNYLCELGLVMQSPWTSSQILTKRKLLYQYHGK